MTLTTDLYFGGGGIVLGMDGAGNAIAAWVGNYADESHYAVLPAGGSWGPVQTLSNGNVQGAAHNLGLAVSPDGSVVVAFANSHDTIWAASGTILSGLSAPVVVAGGDYSKDSAPKVALDDAGQASLVWSQKGGTEAATRSPGGTWSAPAVLSSQSSSSVATAIDGAGNAISVFGSSYSWHRAGGTWGAATALPAGSSGGLVVADPAGIFVYADSSGNAFTFGAGATSFGTGSGSRGSLADLKIVPGLAVMLAARAVSAESVSSQRSGSWHGRIDCGPNWSKAKHRSGMVLVTCSIRSSLASLSGSCDSFQARVRWKEIPLVKGEAPVREGAGHVLDPVQLGLLIRIV